MSKQFVGSFLPKHVNTLHPSISNHRLVALEHPDRPQTARQIQKNHARLWLGGENFEISVLRRAKPFALFYLWMDIQATH